jgi:hypothetical protein
MNMNKLAQAATIIAAVVKVQIQDQAKRVLRCLNLISLK